MTIDLKLRRFMRATALLAAAATLGALQPVLAQDRFPERPVRIIVPWTAGSGIDVQTRAFALAFSEHLGAPVVIDNKSGAGSHLGYEAATQAKPDGYTLFVGTNSQFIHQYLQTNSKTDLLKTMEPVTMLFWLPQVLVVGKNSPIKDVAGLISQARSNPGKLNYASGGIGSGSHVLSSAIAARNGLNVVHVPVRAIASEGLPMLERDDVQFTFPVASLVSAGIKQGKLRAIAVTSKTRLPQLPDVPTLAESFKDARYATDSWNGLFAPAGTPAPIVQKLFDAASKAVGSRQHLDSAEALLTPAAASSSPEAFREFLRAESVKWRDIVRDSGAKLD